MIFYINFLRVIACALITNSHLENVYPHSIIANGGLLGDVIFFAVSAFCLFNIKDNFLKWYCKRLKRIYFIVWIATIFYILVGEYKITGILSFVNMIFWPTEYHFVGSIVLLYIFYYFLIKKMNITKNIKLISIILYIVQVLVYVFLYDKTYYHIDKVIEPMIWFLYMQAMLIGINFRINADKYKKVLNQKIIINCLITIIIFFLYFATKLVFVKEIFSQFQLINQFVLLALLYFIFKTFSMLSNKLDKIPEKIKKIVNYISTITLEIYVVQKPIIKLFENIIFPLNWLIIMFVIILSSIFLDYIVKCIFKLVNKFNNKKEIEE